MNHRRVAVAALAAAGLLAVGACGDPDSQQPAQAQPDRAVVEANLRAADAHRKFQDAVELGRSSPGLLIQDSIDAALQRKQAEEAAAKKVVVYAPASPDAIEHNAIEAAKPRVHYRPFSPDAIEHSALEAADVAPWWAQKR
jgi:hypothetical protein